VKPLLHLWPLALLIVIVVGLIWPDGYHVYGQTTQPATQPVPFASQLGAYGAQIDSLLASNAAQLANARAQAAYLQAQLAAVDQAIDPSQDLAPIAANAKAGQTILLKPNAIYMPSGPLLCNADNVTFAGRNTTIILKPVAGGSTGVGVHSDGCRFSGIHFVGPVVALHIWGPSVIHTTYLGTLVRDCTFDSTNQVGIQTDVGGDDVEVDDCTFQITQAQGIYATGDNLTVTNCTFAGSVGEHPFRAELNGSTGHRPVNLSFLNCSFTNHNALGKECFTAREAIDVVCIHCTFDGWTRFGQGYVDTIVHCDQVLLRDCTWKTLRPGGALSQFERNCGAIVDHCTMPASATDPAFSVNPGTVVTASANTMLVPIGMNPKPLAVPAAGGTFYEVGTIRKAA